MAFYTSSGLVARLSLIVDHRGLLQYVVPVPELAKGSEQRVEKTVASGEGLAVKQGDSLSLQPRYNL